MDIDKFDIKHREELSKRIFELRKAKENSGKGNDAEVHGDAQTVQKQRDSKDSLGRKENRQAENPQDDTGADDIEGPVGKCDKKKVQKSADNCCSMWLSSTLPSSL